MTPQLVWLSQRIQRSMRWSETSDFGADQSMRHTPYPVLHVAGNM